MKSRIVSTIDVREADRPVKGFVATEKGYQEKTLGVITTRSFEGEGVNKLLFRPSQASQAVVNDVRDYQIGHVSDQFQVVDHGEILRPLIAIGYTITRLHYSRGGMNMMATLRPPKPLAITDPIKYDRDLWPSISENSIVESLQVTSSLKPGRGIHMLRGWYRLVCTNGLLSELLQLGKAFFSHRTWNPGHLSETFQEWPQLSSKGDVVLGPLVGNQDGVTKLVGVLTHLLEQRGGEGDESEEEEEPEVMTRRELQARAARSAAQNLPLFVREEIDPFTHMSGWLLVALMEQLAHFNSTAHRKEFHALDLVNAYTSAVNLGVVNHENRSPVRSLTKMEGVLQSSMRLIGGMSL